MSRLRHHLINTVSTLFTLLVLSPYATADTRANKVEIKPAGYGVQNHSAVQVIEQTAQVQETQPETVRVETDETDEVITEADKNAPTFKIPVLEPAADPLGDLLQDRLMEMRKTRTQAETFEISLPLLMDQRYLGDVGVRVSGAEVNVSGESLINLLKPDLTKPALAAMQEAIEDQWLNIGETVFDGVSINYNSELQQVEVTTPLELRDRRVLRIGAEETSRQEVIIEPGNVSLFLSPRISTAYAWNSFNGQDKGFRNPRGILDFGGRLFGKKGFSFLSRQSFETDDSLKFRRDETVLYYDRLDHLMRFSAGDLRQRGTSFQSAPRIAGFSIERFFDLEPNRLFRPVGDAQFELERASTVEVRVNGATRREIALPSGRFSVADLPLTQGSNLVELVIRDDLGRERIISDQSFFDFGLLEKGVMDFSLAGGVKTETTASGALGYSDQFAASGFLRRGMTDSLTMGVDAQGDSSGFNVGSTALYATPIGVLNIEGAYSDYKDIGSGYAGEIAYRALGESRGDWSWSFLTSGRYFSENFSTLRGAQSNLLPVIDLGDDIIIDPALTTLNSRPFKAQFNASSRVRWNRMSLTASGNHSIARGNRFDRTNILGGLDYRINNRFTAGIFGRYSKAGPEEETAAFFQINYRIGRNRDIRVGYDTGLNEANFQYTKTSQRGVGALSYNVSGRSNFDTKNNALFGSAFYVGNRFEATVDQSVLSVPGQFNGDSTSFEQLTRASIGSSLIFIDGTFGLGRPADSAFTIIKGHETLKGKTILVNPTEDGYSNRSDFLGPPVVTEGQAYGLRSIYYDVEDLPLGYDLGEGQYSIRPPLFGGYKIQVGSNASFTVLGLITNVKTGEALPYIGGSLRSLDDPDADLVPAFTNRNGRLAATGLATGRYELILRSDPEYRREVVIPDTSESLIDLGNIQIEVK